MTLRTQMSGLRVFLEWAGSIEAVAENLSQKVLLPRVPREQRRRTEMLDSERAQEILDHLAKFHYASIEHAVFTVFWETGMRLGAVVSLDVGAVDLEDEVFHLVHRPDQGTTLETGKRGERPIAIWPQLATLLEDYIENTRSAVTDEHGREPLFTASSTRRHRTSIRRIIYRVTAPCVQGKQCPDCADDPDLPCPEAVNPHAIRRGSITHFLTEDVPIQIVGDRMDVSRKVLEEHYDKRSEEIKLEQRCGYLDSI
jgi:integrase